MSDECPVCLKEVKLGRYCHGCNHEFCFECISRWATQHRARCPLCNADLYGLYSDDASVYLTPHYGEFGVRLRKNKEYTELAHVSKDSVAHSHELRVGDIIRVNGAYSYHGCLRVLERAKETKRMVRVEVLTRREIEKHEAARYKGRCLVRCLSSCTRFVRRRIPSRSRVAHASDQQGTEQDTVAT